VIIGLGNPVCADDAVGLHVAKRVAELLAEQPLPGVRVLTTTRGGFELLDLLAGSDRAILVDCVAVTGAEPGRVRELAMDQLAGSARLVGAHDISVADVIELGRLAGAPMPRAVTIVGVEVEHVLRLEEALSPAVAAAVEPLAKELYRRLACRTRV
jgi:hydrogenase maturation protease